MAPFHPATLPPEAFDVEATMAKFSLSREDAERAVAGLRRQTVYLNETYQVNVQVIPEPFGPNSTGDVWWLSIKRRDKAPMHDWRELQAIKNAIVGPEHEGFEVYPAESRLVDTANQYHLWVFADPTVRMPVGFQERLVSGPAEAEAIGGRQRAFVEG